VYFGVHQFDSVPHILPVAIDIVHVGISRRVRRSCWSAEKGRTECGHSDGLCFGVISDRIVRSYKYSYDKRGTRISSLASSFKYNRLDLIDNASRQSHSCGRYRREDIGCSQSGYNQSASSIFGKDIEHDFPKEIKTKIKFAFVKNVGEALEEAFGKEVVEGWKKMEAGCVVKRVFVQ